MSIYSLISTPVPTIALSVFHQPPGGGRRDEYMNRLNNIRAQVQSEAASIGSAFQKLLRESAAREAQTLRGLLSQFLYTPISSDDQEVRRLIRESLEKFRAEIVDDVAVGIKFVDEGRLVYPSLKRARDKKLLQNGRSYLQRLGFTVGKDQGDLFESCYAVRGGTNLDLLDTILAQRILPVSPFDTAPPGGPLHSRFGMYTLLFVQGDDPPKVPAEQATEALLLFSPPESMYASLRETILEQVETMATELMPSHVSLWQEKLGLGHGGEYLLRIVAGRMDVMSEGMQWLGLRKGHDAVRRAMIDQGSLLIKELTL
jgi:hypothetical protein